MSPDRPGNIRVFIRWHDQTVFAGEEIKCRITFKNVAPQSSSTAAQTKQASQHDRPGHLSPVHGSTRSKPAGSGLVPPAPARGHRSSLSVTVPASRSRHRSDSGPWSPQNAPEADPPRNGHRRSLSIVSIGSASTADGHPPSTAGSGTSQWSSKGHTRASSLQIAPRGHASNGPRSGDYHLAEEWGRNQC